MSNTTSLKGQRPNLDGTCPNGLYLPCMYNNKLSYICDPFGDRSKTVACSRVDTIVQCPILSGGPPTYCSENVQPNIPPPPPQPQPQPQPPSPSPPQPHPQPQPKPQTSSELPVGMKKVNVSFMAYVLHIILIIASIIVIICYSRQIPKNKAMLSVNVCTLILQLVTVVIVLFI
jgi:hypothetical protein